MSSTKPDLPNPTGDLNWSAFRGVIQDNFSTNAEAHPDRLFGYPTWRDRHVLQLQRSRLSCHRHGNPESWSDFLSYRSVVPPDRQNIYLDVARPRALVVIDKGTREGGELTEKVRNFIHDNLQLRTEVPGLELKDDGTLVGGNVNSKDVLAEQLSLNSKSPGVVVRPDSTPTPSFTSGPEGRPKGVRGRHYSLAYYFDWMTEQFHLTENDKFTMLRTQLLVPSKDDIQHERLAEWMLEHGATITHLTPAMGQILVGGASAEFPALYHSFFVGDILIKRDCKSLQRLAPNLFIVNMYRTTEIQPVSYYEIPRMKDVQLLIVDRENRNRICDVGEIREIYVRAAGLAEGYLGSDELKKTKGLQNHFPRSHGENSIRVQEICIGRADDQVKIRGFRIELGEIDKYLSDHEMVLDNTTLVRRNKDEEQMLVSYIVPDMQKWSLWLEQKGLVDDTSGPEGMPKQLSFVSSTSVLDTPYFVKLSQDSATKGGSSVSEDDDLSGSVMGLGTGYGQSKWVAEYLVRAAGARGLRGTIIRPGYATGDKTSGVTSTDDFLIRMTKGCIQLGCRPKIANTVNMVPVNHVERVVVAAAFSPPKTPLAVAQVTSHPRLTFSQYLATLQTYGYNVPEVEYSVWKKKLGDYALADDGREQHAL
ncbi:hypothetical protein G7Y89_g10353 [Cudoniella acicularis]|uniref:L-aminoadipate-semialdehyde dehydrogenase n=1 Tax=Cudoniella acicularis TaxID=354080 RepID=A0A8H4RFP6_9HELO|nr:hypothetical protein G7Y89_g10353 [Cudoniella acicularis]